MYRSVCTSHVTVASVRCVYRSTRAEASLDCLSLLLLLVCSHLRTLPDLSLCRAYRTALHCLDECRYRYLLEACVSTYGIVRLRVQHTRRTSTPLCSCIDVLVIKMVTILCDNSLLAFVTNRTSRHAYSFFAEWVY